MLRGAYARRRTLSAQPGTHRIRGSKGKTHLANEARTTSIWPIALRSRSPSFSFSFSSPPASCSFFAALVPAPFFVTGAASSEGNAAADPSDSRPSSSSEPKMSRGGDETTMGERSSSRIRRSSYVSARETSTGLAARPGESEKSATHPRLVIGPDRARQGQHSLSSNGTASRSMTAHHFFGATPLVSNKTSNSAASLLAPAA
jgi:hypothetical protein